MKFLKLLLVVPLAGARVVSSQQQVPIFEEVAENATPHIGVHFTNSYALAAARCQNGTTRDIVKVAGNAEYIGLMSRWMDAWNADRGLQNPRTLPTTGDAVILSNFFSKVRIAVEKELDTPVTHITPATFPLRPAHKQGFQDALAFAGLASTILYTEAEAAYYALSQQTSHTPHPSHPSHLTQTILYLSFDNSSFSASTYRLSSHPTQNLNLISFQPRSTLGWWNMPVDSLPRARFWAKVQECVVDAVNEMGEPPGRIVMLGSHGEMEEFKGVVEEGLWREWEVDVGMLVSGQEEVGEWLVARGAAELGSRGR
jgi:hypothetical protein